MEAFLKFLLVAALAPYWYPLLRTFVMEALEAGEEPTPPPPRRMRRRDRTQNPAWETGRRPDHAPSQAFVPPVLRGHEVHDLPRAGSDAVRQPLPRAATGLRGGRWTAGFGRRGT